MAVWDSCCEIEEHSSKEDPPEELSLELPLLVHNCSPEFEIPSCEMHNGVWVDSPIEEPSWLAEGFSYFLSSLKVTE